MLSSADACACASASSAAQHKECRRWCARAASSTHVRSRTCTSPRRAFSARRAPLRRCAEQPRSHGARGRAVLAATAVLIAWRGAASSVHVRSTTCTSPHSASGGRWAMSIAYRGARGACAVPRLLPPLAAAARLPAVGCSGSVIDHAEAIHPVSAHSDMYDDVNDGCVRICTDWHHQHYRYITRRHVASALIGSGGAAANSGRAD